MPSGIAPASREHQAVHGIHRRSSLPSWKLSNVVIWSERREKPRLKQLRRDASANTPDKSSLQIMRPAWILLSAVLCVQAGALAQQKPAESSAKSKVDLAAITARGRALYAYDQ